VSVTASYRSDRPSDRRCGFPPAIGKSERPHARARQARTRTEICGASPSS